MTTLAHASESSAAALVEPAGGHVWDLFLVGLVIAVALTYLYRKLWTKRGACSDCSSGGPSCSTGCGPKKIEFDTTTPLRKTEPGA